MYFLNQNYGCLRDVFRPLSYAIENIYMNLHGQYKRGEGKGEEIGAIIGSRMQEEEKEYEVDESLHHSISTISPPRNEFSVSTVVALSYDQVFQSP